jgi:hypothetical protein
MPTHVVFTGGEITLEQEFDKVNSQFGGSGAGAEFTISHGGDSRRVVVYRDNVLYIEDYEGVEPFVALST